MSFVVEPFAEAETSKEKIFRATYLAQVEHGYTDLSIQHIADEASLSKSTIYHHFADKDELMLEYARELLEWYIDTLLLDAEGDPFTQLEWSLDLVFLDETAEGMSLDDIRPAGLSCVYMGLRMEATQNEEMREYFDTLDRIARTRLQNVIQMGIENGTIQQDVDAEQVAAVLYVMLEGGLYFRSTEHETDWLGAVREMIDGYLDGLKVDQ